MLNAGKLRHRVEIQRPVEQQDPESGAMDVVWQLVATVWCSIEPISARELLAAQIENSKVTTRIRVRYRQDIDQTCRLYHSAKNKYYNVEGIVSDAQSGLEYIVLPCSEGLRYQTSES